MASRMKKLFHRKKDGNELDSTAYGSQQSPYHDESDPGLRTSLYDATSPGGLPQTGEYPIKGDDRSNVLRKKPSRRSSIRSWRSSSGSQHAASYRPPTPDQYDSRGMAGSPPYTEGMGPESYGPEVPKEQKRWSRSQLPLNVSALNLGNEAPTLMASTTTTTTTHTSVSPNAPRASPQTQRQGYSNANTSSIRAVNPSDVQQAYTRNQSPIQPKTKHATNGYDSKSGRANYDGQKMNTTSIPRKEVGAGPASVPVPQSATSPSQMGHSRRRSSDKSLPATPAPLSNQPPIQSQLPNRNSRDMSGSKELPSAPVAPANASGLHKAQPAQSATAVLDKTRSVKPNCDLDADTVVAKAKTNTKDTEVIETYAPAVVHETVHKDVHHIREELITREIHNHDVYHRILPVVDVEVLPPRHFLPVEGGGLVEISAGEVPGRGNNWVIAETASKIPSDQPAPTGRRGFTARAFPGDDGDAIAYTANEGHEKTEQTWIHPPQLETGARDTGQSWPIVFGDETPKKGTYGYKSPKSSNKKTSKSIAGTQSSPTRRA